MGNEEEQDIEKKSPDGEGECHGQRPMIFFLLNYNIKM